MTEERNSRREIEKDCWVFPAPVTIVSCGNADGTGDITACSWTGNISSEPPMAYISLGSGSRARQLIEETGEFVINLTDENMVRAADICGNHSGLNTDKWEMAGLTPMKAVSVSAPIIGESPVSVECRVKQVIPLGSHDMILGEVLHVTAKEELVDEYGKLRLGNAGLLTLVRRSYIPVGDEAEHIGFTVRRRSEKAVIKESSR